MKYVLVLGAQVPFVRGGAELLNETLVDKINMLDGFEAQLVQLPYKWYPEEQLLDDIMSWRMLDLSESNGKKIDLVIATKFPAYAGKHSNKILWLVHQHRYFYDLEFTQYDAYHNVDNSKQTRDKIRQIDSKLIKESKHIFTIAKNVSQRLKHYNNIDSIPLYPPAPLSEKIEIGKYEDYIIYIGRIETIKRVDLIVDAFTHIKSKAKLVIIGKGDDTLRIKDLIKKNNLEKQIQMLGYVSNEQLLEKLVNSKALFYAPFDEDYGYATIEAYLAKKLVITCIDSGEVANIVSDTKSGYITLPKPKEIAKVIDEIYGFTNQELEYKAQAGYDFAQNITWENVLQKLVLDNV